MNIPPATLDDLTWGWGDAYLFSYARDRWIALRRDARYFVTAETLAGLEQAIMADYRGNPVSRDYDPLRAAGGWIRATRRMTKATGTMRLGISFSSMARRPFLPRCGKRSRCGPSATTGHPRLDRPEREKDHHRKLSHAAVRRPHPDRAQAPAARARSWLGLIAAGGQDRILAAWMGDSLGGWALVCLS